MEQNQVFETERQRIQKKYDDLMKQDKSEHATRLDLIERMVSLASAGVTTADAELADLVNKLTHK